MSCKVSKEYNISNSECKLFEDTSDYIQYSNTDHITEEDESIHVDCPFEEENELCIFHADDPTKKERQKAFDKITSQEYSKPLIFIELDLTEFLKDSTLEIRDSQEIHIFDCEVPDKIKSVNGDISIYSPDQKTLNITLSEFTSVSILGCTIEGIDLNGSNTNEINIIYGNINNTDFIKNDCVSQLRVASVISDHLPKDLLSKKINFSDSTFEKTVNFSDSTFEKTVNFSDSTFKGEAHFRSIFKKGADFSDSTFVERADFISSTFKKGGANFMGSEFKKGADFSGSTFKKGADFSDSTFEERAKFGSKFKGNTIFRDSKFKGEANFSGSKFKGNTIFRDSKFKGEALFSTTFEKGPNFSNSTFVERANFSNSTFEGEADFRLSTFIERANFSNSTFEGEADFSNSTFKEGAALADLPSGSTLRNSDFSDSDLRDCDLTGCNLYKVYLGNCQINSNTEFFKDKKLVWGNKTYQEHLEDDVSGIDELEEIRDIYRQIEVLSKQNSIGRTQSIAFLNKKDLTKQIKKKKIWENGDISEVSDYLWLKAQSGIFRYGESPSIMVKWSALTVIGYALLYFIFHSWKTSNVHIVNDLPEALLYSILTFTGIGGKGRGLLKLNSTFIEWFIASESVLGVLFIAFLIFTVTRSAST